MLMQLIRKHLIIEELKKFYFRNLINFSIKLKNKKIKFFLTKLIYIINSGKILLSSFFI